MKRLKVEYKRETDRGALVQVVTGVYQQLNVLKIKRGNTFGGHYHIRKHEFFHLLKGAISLCVKNVRTGHEKHVPIKEKDALCCFTIEPYEVHNLYADKDSILVETLSEPYDEQDTYEEINDA